MERYGRAILGRAVPGNPMKVEGFTMHTRIQGEPLSASTINRWITRSQQKIDLRSPRPPREHRQARTRIIAGIVCVAVVVALALHWLYQRMP
jgi:hypothetical protein